MSIYIIGDIHGCFDTFKALLKQLPENARICLVGDLIDRGPKSKQVVQYVIDNKIDCVKGNHEVMMYEQPEYWPVNGGIETLESYCEDPADYGYQKLDRKLFEEHQDWMRELPVYLEYPEIKNEDGRHLVVSHSLIHNVWKYRNDPDRNEMFFKHTLWTRDFRSVKDNPEIHNVIGHTPQKFTVGGNKIWSNVDTGCCYKQYEEHGILSCIKFPEMEIFTQKNIEQESKKIVDTL